MSAGTGAPTTPPNDGKRRVQAILAEAGFGSRRSCEEFILAGRVAVNGQIITLGARADAAHDQITVDGQPIAAEPAKLYLAMNKPPGYVTTAADELGRPAVLDLLPPQPARVFPVGRLDMDSEGLLLLTNDGELAARLTHPRYEAPREYLAWVRGLPDPEALNNLRRGVVLDGVLCVPRRVLLRSGRPTDVISVLELVLTEGRKREVRRICEAVGHPVERLIRVRVGPVRLGALAPGAVRPLTTDEVAALRASVGLRDTKSGGIERRRRE
ncbi:MAG: pseudouridine synthase [Chloroflexi bacterium]|nr:pseudouridine synthase [Chloroflexota bacterium]